MRVKPNLIDTGICYFDQYSCITAKTGIINKIRKKKIEDEITNYGGNVKKFLCIKWVRIQDIRSELEEIEALKLGVSHARDIHIIDFIYDNL